MPTYDQLRTHIHDSLAAYLEPEEAQAEAGLWLEEGLGRNRAWMVGFGDAPVPEKELDRVEAWLARRQHGEPWAYLLGWTPWRGRRFAVSPATLIPRPETELVLEAALEVGRRLGLRRVVDVGTGTGILGISLALETDWVVTATDLSSAALEVARENARVLGARVQFFQGHLLEPIREPLGLVLSNPPYVDPADASTLQRELSFEPASALFAPEHGLALSKELLAAAHLRMAPACVLEIGSGQGAELVAWAKGQGWSRVMVHQDFAGHDRVLVAVR